MKRPKAKPVLLVERRDASGHWRPVWMPNPNISEAEQRAGLEFKGQRLAEYVRVGR